jgi:hypothetical protein
VPYKGNNWCVREGSELPALAKPDASVSADDQGSGLWYPEAGGTSPDSMAKADAPTVKKKKDGSPPAPDSSVPDTFVPPDLYPPTPDKGSPTHSCAHSPCSTGGPLLPGCHSCGISSVCSSDLFCCYPIGGYWDISCVNSYKKMCTCP